MYQTEESREEKKRFMQSAVKKQQRNKRKREPDMFKAAVLECTVRRLGSEVSSLPSCFCVSRSKRRKCRTPDVSKEQNRTEDHLICQDLQNYSTINSPRSSNDYCTLSKVEATNTIQERTRYMQDEGDLEEFLRDLTSGFSDVPSFESVEEMIRELECDTTLDVLEDEIEALLDTGEHFQPGFFDVLFS